MSVHYKFKNSLDVNTVTFDGVHISVGDLKKEILKQKKLGKGGDFDLQITDAETKKAYETDDLLVPKNSSVTVARVPLAEKVKKPWNRKNDDEAPVANTGKVSFESITKSSDLSASYDNEEDKIKAMVSQSTSEYDPINFTKSRGLVGPLPANYTCYRCGQGGHYIKQCPTNNMDIKRSTGIPRSFMRPANADEKGALLTANGDYAVPIIDAEAYKEIKKEKPPFVAVAPGEEPETAAPVPEDIQCLICRNLLQDAVLTPCCGNGYCDECVRTALLESDQHECPTCHEVDISPDTLIPSRKLRKDVIKYKNDTGYSPTKKVGLQINIKPETVHQTPEKVSAKEEIISNELPVAQKQENVESTEMVLPREQPEKQEESNNLLRTPDTPRSDADAINTPRSSDEASKEIKEEGDDTVTRDTSRSPVEHSDSGHSPVDAVPTSHQSIQSLGKPMPMVAPGQRMPIHSHPPPPFGPPSRFARYPHAPMLDPYGNPRYPVYPPVRPHGYIDHYSRGPAGPYHFPPRPPHMMHVQNYNEPPGAHRVYLFGGPYGEAINYDEAVENFQKHLQGGGRRRSHSRERRSFSRSRSRSLSYSPPDKERGRRPPTRSPQRASPGRRPRRGSPARRSNPREHRDYGPPRRDERRPRSPVPRPLIRKPLARPPPERIDRRPRYPREEEDRRGNSKSRDRRPDDRRDERPVEAKRKAIERSVEHEPEEKKVRDDKEPEKRPEEKSEGKASKEKEKDSTFNEPAIPIKEEVSEEKLVEKKQAPKEKSSDSRSDDRKLKDKVKRSDEKSEDKKSRDANKSSRDSDKKVRDRSSDNNSVAPRLDEKRSREKTVDDKAEEKSNKDVKRSDKDVKSDSNSSKEKTKRSDDKSEEKKRKDVEKADGDKPDEKKSRDKDRKLRDEEKEPTSRDRDDSKSKDRKSKDRDKEKDSKPKDKDKESKSKDKDKKHRHKRHRNSSSTDAKVKTEGEGGEKKKHKSKKHKHKKSKHGSRGNSPSKRSSRKDSST